MRFLFTGLVCVCLVGTIKVGGFAQESAPAKPKRVMKTDQEWAKVLTREQFLVTRRKATEPAFSGKYVSNHARGTYLCVCCDAELFGSNAKFDSGTGWPSFWRPAQNAPIATAPDYSDGTERIEVECQVCSAHLGHVFSDGPPPTGLRYCINSASLRFVRDATAKPVSKKTTKGKAAPKSKDKVASKAKDETPKDDSKSADKPSEKDASAPKAKKS